MMRSATSDGVSPDVCRKRFAKESFPKNFPEASVASSIPSVYSNNRSPDSRPCVALEYFAEVESRQHQSIFLYFPHASLAQQEHWRMPCRRIAKLPRF